MSFRVKRGIFYLYINHPKQTSMKKIFTLFALCFATTGFYAQNITFHDHTASTIQGDTISMSQYYGKKLMVVNTASQCAFTPQYGELEDLYNQYKQYNFEILGFPCNDFNHQEPGSDSTIDQFCTNTYNITFQMMSKIFIVTGDTAPVYKWLQREDLNGVQNVSVSWNFNKFLIDEAGNWVMHHNSTTSPLDTAITNWIMSPSVLSTGPFDKNEIITFRSSNPVSDYIDFTLNSPSQEHLCIDLFSMDGRLVNTFYNGVASGAQNISYSATLLSPGIYFIKIGNNEFHKTIRCAVIR